ncbi:DEAD/DEAH box helicase [Glaciecola sp. 33A]|uniref:preprotein translocase subunit SecA n=1 Tax=Glaciecola sp. 33A TaxID=2057807 RepID=UPI0012FEEDF6|nr:DEAD/DEAH box helicase [Glaciecola sp. 33A]
MIKRIMARLQKSSVETTLKPFHKTLIEIHALGESLKSLSIQDLKARIPELDTQAKVFAAVIEASHRLLGMRPFDSQILAGLALFEGFVIDMKTGEGKTLAAAAPNIANALAGRKVYLLTFNDYLAKRDSDLLLPLYEFFGLTVGVIQADMSSDERRLAYQSDIIYATAREVGFDFLRDQLCLYSHQIVLTKLDVAIVDEADSILVDEARIPLVISGNVNQPNEHLTNVSKAVRDLVETVDYNIDKHHSNVHLTDVGTHKIEKQFDCENLYDVEHLPLLTSVNLALHAQALLIPDVDYIVKGKNIKLIDEFTGRIAENRRWPDGMQSALEAKESLAVKKEGQTLGSITLQHLMSLFNKVSGMSGTAELAAEELYELYHLTSCVIPPCKPCMRIDKPDRVFIDNHSKDAAICQEIDAIHKTGQPILIGTPNISESERLHALLLENGITGQLLNAKNDQDEAHIIAGAGALGAVTICTNLAGRGTDISLGAGAKDLGGLHIIGTSRFESRRIDDQLRGRSARQGNPGSSQYFVSLTDKLFNHFTEEEFGSIKALQGELNAKAALNKKIAHAQRVIEGANLERRKTLHRYSEVVEHQRRGFQKLREDILHQNGVEAFIEDVDERWQGLSHINNDKRTEALVIVVLYNLDKVWIEYLSEIDYIKESIHLNGAMGTSSLFGGSEPYHVFIRQAHEVFEQLIGKLKDAVVDTFNGVVIDENGIDPDSELFDMTKSTSSYVVVDNPFNGMDSQVAKKFGQKMKKLGF